MSNGIPFITIPDTDTTLLVPVVAICGGMVIVAVVSELYRQHARERARIQEEWDTVNRAVAEKGLSEAERDLLQHLIKKHSPKSPVLAITVRQHFDECVLTRLSELERSHSAQFESTGALLRDIRERLGLHYLPFGPSIRSTRELHTGQVVMFSAGLDQQAAKGARGTICDINEAVFYVTAEEDSNLKPYTPDSIVHFSLWRDDDARYAFQTKLVRIEENPTRLVFLHATALNRMQSREYYRIGFEQNTSVGILNASVDGSEDDVHLRPVVTRTRGRFTNISAGGFAIIIPQPVPRQVLLRVTLNFEGTDSFDVEARIVSTISLPGGQYLVRASYVGVNEDTRDRIVHYIFRRQQPLQLHADAIGAE